MNSKTQRPMAGFGLPLRLLSHLRLWQKFMLLAVVLVPAVAVPSYEFYATTQQGIDFAEKEQNGLAPSLKLLELVKVAQQHRGLTAGVLGGNRALSDARSDKEAEHNRLIDEMDDLMKDITNQELIETWRSVKSVFPEIARDINDGAMDADASFEAHTELIADYVGTLENVIDYYNLSLDPDSHTYHLIQAALVGLPALTEPFGQLRGLGTGALAAEQEAGISGEGKKLSADLRARLATLASSGARNLDFVRRNIEKAMREAPELAEEGLPEALTAVEEETAKMLELSRDRLISATTLNYDSAEFFQRLTQGINKQLAFSETVSTALREQLQKKVTSLTNQQFAQGGIIGLIVIIAALLGLAVVRSVLQPVSHLRGVMEGLQAGDSSLRAGLESGDEIGELARQFDSMVDEREAISEQIKEENDALNESIIAILRPVSKTAQGDLTASAPMREDVTGALADAINSMAHATAQTLAKVTTAAREVRSASQTGRDTVLETSQGMNEIRATIQETGKRIKRLGEQSQEITGIVKLIDDIAERTSVLALNANMQAAMAGEAGRGFRVVADEVQSLAERSKEATDQIGKLVDTIQAETNDTMTTMDRAINDVVKGGELAEQAAQQVTHLDELGEELLEAIGAFKLPEDVIREQPGGETPDRRAA